MKRHGNVSGGLLVVFVTGPLSDKQGAKSRLLTVY